MRIAATLICAALTVSQAKSAPLSAADREALIESLEALRDSAGARVDARFQVAISAYRQAMSSSESVIEFYLKCIEKVDFEDKDRKPADFRDWKRREADNLSNPEFRLALRYQLRWLVLTLQASSAKPDRVAIAGNAQEIVDALCQDANKLTSQGQLLRQSVTSTVFARAYEVGGLQNDKWPLSPLSLEQIYNSVILPPLRSPDHLESLRSAWIKRIQQQGIEAEAWSGNGRGRRNGGGQAPPTVISDRFTTETLPELQWQMEMDLFSSGDESGAARRMLTHLEKYITHKSVRKWGEDFKNLLKPQAIPEPTAVIEPPTGY